MGWPPHGVAAPSSGLHSGSERSVVTGSNGTGAAACCGWHSGGTAEWWRRGVEAPDTYISDVRAFVRSLPAP